jgi:hypothetical protein
MSIDWAGSIFADELQESDLLKRLRTARGLCLGWGDFSKKEIRIPAKVMKKMTTSVVAVFAIALFVIANLSEPLAKNMLSTGIVRRWFKP